MKRRRDAARFARDDLRALEGYTEDVGPGLNLMTNTNAWGPSPAVEKALRGLALEDIAQYPDRTTRALREAIAGRNGLDPEEVVTGNGSDDLIDVVLRTVVRPGDRVTLHPPTFSLFAYFARIDLAEVVPVPLTRRFALDVEGTIAAKPRVAIVCSPNNPTGTCIARKDVERLLDGVDGVVVLDEAYIEFGGVPGHDLIASHENLVILRTFSKAYGLAGLRMGYCLADRALAAEIGKSRGPYRVSAVGERLALAAYGDAAHLARVVAETRASRELLTRGLAALGLEPVPSEANFVFVRIGPKARALVEHLAGRGILVRGFRDPMLAPFIRISVAPSETMDRVLAEVGAWLRR